ncbi:Transmembrane secretion effector [Pedobacter westerhofensis]|uniref:Transmembrane secretion effector n=1 Tax=Pedobacter westerhofensis TaxID=425512 RepID=A0A521E436_9SPHI|nr:MFS transporter [Pedobacter westerhofensis]SMO78699.1 Transmembrane secretion effector [Pedobacter westerhofensis]
MQLSQAFRLLKSRNFALFYWGQLLSRLGTWIQRTAVIWIVYSVTHSVFMVGVTTFAEQFPSFLFSIRGGIIADKYNRYTIIFITQILSAVQAIILTIYTFSGNFNMVVILALSVFLGIVNAYDVPVRQSMINDMIGNKDDLPNAVALNSSLNTLARLAGPALSGILLASYGAAFCFLSNAVSFLAVIAAIAAMKMPKNVPVLLKTKTSGKLKEAIDYLKSNPPIAVIIWISCLSNFFVLSYVTLLPVYAKDIFKGDATTYGWLNSSAGIGALIGALWLAMLGKQSDFRKIMWISILLTGISLLLFAYCHNLYLSLFFSALCGLGAIVQSSMMVTIVQSETDSLFRGRVVSFIAMSIFGMLPLGSLLVGYLAPHAGASFTLFAEGIIAIIISGLFYQRLINTTIIKQSDYGN